MEAVTGLNRRNSVKRLHADRDTVMEWNPELRIPQAVILDQSLNRVGTRATLQRGLSYDPSRPGNLLRSPLGNTCLAEDRVPLRSKTMSHRQSLYHLFRRNIQVLSSRRRANLLEKLPDRFPVGPVKIGAHYRPHTGPPTMQTRLTSHDIQRVTEQVLRTTTRPRATSNTHRNPTTDQGLDDSPDALLATLDNLLHIPRNQLRAHQRQLRRIITIVLILQLVSKLPILYSTKLCHNIPTPSRQQIVGRIRYHANIANDSNRRLRPDRVGLGTTLDGSIRAGDSIMARGCRNAHERNRRFRGGKLAQIDILAAPDRQHDGWPSLLDRLYDLVQNGLGRFLDYDMVDTKPSLRRRLGDSNPRERIGYGSRYHQGHAVKP